MTQIHKIFTVDQIKVLFRSYDNGHISRTEIVNTLGIGKTRFFALLKQYRENPDNFSIEYHRQSKPRLSNETEEIRDELQRDKKIVEDKLLPITEYNYAAVTDRLKKVGIQVSTTTKIKRAIQYDCYLRKKKKKDRHDREVITSATGDLIQHDASFHKWSPSATEKWTLITARICLMCFSCKLTVERTSNVFSLMKNLSFNGTILTPPRQYLWFTRHTLRNCFLYFKSADLYYKSKAYTLQL